MMKSAVKPGPDMATKTAPPAPAPSKPVEPTKGESIEKAASVGKGAVEKTSMESGSKTAKQVDTKSELDTSAKSKSAGEPDFGNKPGTKSSAPEGAPKSEGPIKSNPFGDSELGAKSPAPTKSADFGAKTPPPPPSKPGMDSDAKKVDVMEKSMMDKAMAKQAMDKKVVGAEDDFDASDDASDHGSHDSDSDDASAMA
ncbi:MAG: hypothetical protein H3C47_09855 [Candidatus Cloacimonetes bacterium]|nr:hypothetical protein [Candidatus Cloacimonadota bacterium]